MHEDWSRAIHRVFAGGEARFDLPVRPLGWGRLFGVLLAGFGLLFAWMPARTAWHSVQGLQQNGADLGNVLFSIFPLLFVVAGSVPLGIGLLILFGRCRVEWKDGRLRATEILGPLRWTRRLPRKVVRKLEVGAATSKSGSAAPREIPRFSALVAEFEDGSKRMVALGYPKDWLLPLAQELKALMGGGQFAPSIAVAVAEGSPVDRTADDVTEQPAGSRVLVEERGAGVRLVVPPAGVWRGSKGLFLFGLFWCAFMAVFTAFSVTGSGKRPSSIPMAFWFFIPTFWLIGLGLLAGAINMGRRSATLEVIAGRLCVEIRGLFGSKQREWTRSDLVAIRADASGMEVNDRPVIELQFHPRRGKKVGLLAGHDEQELRWMATRLRRVMNVPARLPEA